MNKPLLDALCAAFLSDGPEDMSKVLEANADLVRASTDEIFALVKDPKISPTFRARLIEEYVCSEVPPVGSKILLVIIGLRSLTSRVGLSAVAAINCLDKESRQKLVFELSGITQDSPHAEVRIAARECLSRLRPDQVRCVGGKAHGHVTDYVGPVWLAKFITAEGGTSEVYRIRLTNVFGVRTMFYVHEDLNDTTKFGTEMMRLLDKAFDAEKACW